MRNSRDIKKKKKKEEKKKEEANIGCVRETPCIEINTAPLV